MELAKLYFELVARYSDVRSWTIAEAIVVNSSDVKIYHLWMKIILNDLHFCCRWFCHFDDDNYVNLEALVRTLDKFDSGKDWYLGKTSIKDPIEVIDRTAALTFSKESVS